MPINHLREEDAIMSGANDRTNAGERTMTVTDMTAQHAETIATLRRNIRSILGEANEPLGHSAIEAHLQKRRVDEGGPLAPLSTIDIRDAIEEMVDDGEARYTVGRKVQIIR